MSRLPCPNCGATLDCGAEAPGQAINCPACGTALRLELEAGGKRATGAGRSMRKRMVLLVLLASALGFSFVAGGGLGFVFGRESAAAEVQRQQPGIHLNAVGFFGAHNEVRITDAPPPLVPATTPRQKPQR